MTEADSRNRSGPGLGSQGKAARLPDRGVAMPRLSFFDLSMKLSENIQTARRRAPIASPGGRSGDRAAGLRPLIPRRGVPFRLYLETQISYCLAGDYFQIALKPSSSPAKSNAV